MQKTAVKEELNHDFLIKQGFELTREKLSHEFLVRQGFELTEHSGLTWYVKIIDGVELFIVKAYSVYLACAKIGKKEISMPGFIDAEWVMEFIELNKA